MNTNLMLEFEEFFVKFEPDVWNNQFKILLRDREEKTGKESTKMKSC